MDPDGAVTVDDRDPNIVTGLSPEHVNDPPNLPGAEVWKYLETLDFYGGTESTECNPGWYAQYTFFGECTRLWYVGISNKDAVRKLHRGIRHYNPVD